jgi:hypothetical protein
MDPTGDESQYVPVQLAVTHRAIVAVDDRGYLANFSSIDSPTQYPEAPKKALGDHADERSPTSRSHSA